MKAKHLAIIIAVVFLLGALSGALVHRAFNRPIVTKVDTVTVWKTAALDSLPKTVETKPAPASIPDIVIPTEQLTPSQDSSSVSVRPQMTTVSGTLSGGLTYQAQLTGIQPSIQSLQVSYPETQVTKTVLAPYKGWLLSATTDAFLYTSPKIQFSTKAGLETSYNTGPFHFGVQAGVLVTRSDSWNVSPYIGARVTIDIFKMR